MKLTELLSYDDTRAQTGLGSLDNMLREAFGNTLGSSELPVSVDKAVWQTLENPTRLARLFVFDSLEKKKYFLNELLAYQAVENHDAKITIEGGEVRVETYTHDINNVSNQDLKLARFADEIYRDTRFFVNEQ
jgi:pterin-4a-carbinolamine dehydratase